MKRIITLLFASFIINHAYTQQNISQYIFTSDVHFGLTKATFRNQTNVSSAEVNAAAVDAMNLLPSLSLPDDKGISAGKNIGGIDAVIITGDICNRQEKGVQSASASWKQFEEDYINHLHLTDRSGNKTTLLLTPGNHDITNAIGYHKPMEPLVDKASMIGMYNLMLHPSVLKTENNYNYPNDKIHFSTNISGIHLMFVDAWPDSAERVWMEKDLKEVKASTPVFVFTHSMPNVEARFFVNPNGNHSINEKDKFENLLVETFKDGSSVEDNTLIEQKAFASFVQQHPNIKVYFHGHSNYTEFYDWKGPDQNINLHCIRADSPMKGKYSAKDETKLAFNLVTVDADKKLLTVRECLWNAHSTSKNEVVEWGSSVTFSIQ